MLVRLTSPSTVSPMSDADALAGQAEPGERTASLNGEWAFRPASAEEWKHGTVPGDVHTDLLRGDAVSDPFVVDNEPAVQWVGETDWEYRRTVGLGGDLLDHDAVLLECLSLDTVAQVTVNGSTVLETATAPSTSRTASARGRTSSPFASSRRSSTPRSDERSTLTLSVS